MNSPRTRGFTLVELLVSITIFTLITVVSVFNYSSFNSSVELTNLAYEIALSIRQAQFYGITVKQSTLSNNFNSGYGIHFDLTSPASQATYVLFEDVDTDHVYDSGEAIDTFAIQKGNKIRKVCLGTPGNGNIVCNNANTVDVSFLRPNPDSFIVKDANTSQTLPSAVVCLSSPKGTYRSITVTSTGQISVSTDQATCGS